MYCQFSLQFHNILNKEWYLTIPVLFTITPGVRSVCYSYGSSKRLIRLPLVRHIVVGGRSSRRQETVGVSSFVVLFAANSTLLAMSASALGISQSSSLRHSPSYSTLQLINAIHRQFDMSFLVIRDFYMYSFSCSINKVIHLKTAVYCHQYSKHTTRTLHNTLRI